MTRDELQTQLEDILDGVVDDAYRDDHESVHEIAKRILALLPPQPKLEWRGDCLILGTDFCTGYVSDGAPSGWDGYVNEEMVACDVPVEEARAAVEEAVRKALVISA